MKATKLLAVLGVATFAAGVLGTTAVQAASGTSEGKVQFVEDEEEEVVDPTKPGVVDPIDPPEIVLPPIKENGTKIVYYPSIDFGVHYVTSKEVKYNAVLSKDDTWTGTGEEEVGTDGILPAFLQVQHDWDVTNWDIKATLGDFVQGTNGGILKDAKVVFNNVTPVNQAGNAITNTSATFTLVAGSDDPQDIASFTNASPEAGDGLSINSVLFGTVSATPEAGTKASLMQGTDGYEASDKVMYNNGITLELPSASGMKAGVEYTANLTWTLSSTLQP